MNFTIPKDSKAYECTAPGWTSRENEKWVGLFDSSFDLFSIGLSPVRRDAFGRVGILIVENQNTLTTNRIKIEFGDATKPRGQGRKIIAQVVNTSGALGIGFGKSLSKNYPIVKTSLSSWVSKKHSFILGNSQLVAVQDDIYVFQMLAQKGLYAKGDEIPLKYSSLRKGLIGLRLEAINLGATVHMPLIGAGQAKGNWTVISGMIHEELVNHGIPVNVYMLPGKVLEKDSQNSLTLFSEKTTWEKEK